MKKVAFSLGKKPVRGGYTLVEVLVAASVGTTVILVMLATMTAGTRGFDQATRRIDALVEARAAMGVLSDDVATMIGLEGRGFGWEQSEGRFHRVYFLTLKPLNAQDMSKAVGDVCFVHFFTAVTPDSPFEGAAVSRKLYRQFINSADLVEALRAGELPVAEASPEAAEVIAFNVTRFVAEPLVQPVGGGPMVPWVAGERLPSSLAIDLQVVDGDTARLLRGEQDWNLTSELARNLIVENGKGVSTHGRDFRMNLRVGHAN